jgi:hypothetical protein
MLGTVLLAALATAVVRDSRVVSMENPRAVFRMASLSKVVTAYAVQQLEREGRVDSDADIGAYLPDLPMHRHGGAKVTLRHLLTHTSGIDDAFLGNVVPLGKHIPTLEEHFRARPPHFGRPPGAQVLYSNEGIALTGLIIERVTKLPFAAYVQRRIFEPLGMRSSSFAQPPPFGVIPSGAEHEALVQAPSGAMVSNAEDMAKLMIALLSSGAPYGMFAGEIGGRPGLFHTGRSGHESVLYLIPAEKLGVFMVHTGGLDRALRRRFVESIVGSGRPAPRDVHVASGTYRPILLPLTRVERAGELATDAEVRATGSTITVRLPPFALGQTLVFQHGLSADGYRISGAGGRFIITGPLLDPVTFERIPWWTCGRAQLIAFALAILIILIEIFRAHGAARVAFALILAFLIAAPLTFLALYLPCGAESRPFHVASSLRAAMVMLLLAAVTAVVTPWIARRRHLVASLAALGIVCALLHWNLLCFAAVG